MAKKKIQPAMKQWFFPTEGVTVEARTYKDALALATGQKEEEEGDAVSGL